MEVEYRYFWQRMPSWLERLVVGSLCAVGALGLIVGGLAWLAQLNSDPIPRYSLSMHVVAMSAVAGLGVAVAVGLWRLRQPLLAGVVLVGVVVGPMTLVAVPVRGSLMANPMDTKWWWHAVVSIAVGSVLTGWAWWAHQCLGRRAHVPPRESSSVIRQTLQFALFVLAAMAAWVGFNETPMQSNAPVMRAIVGWALLAGGIVVVAAFAATAWTSLALLTGSALTLGAIFAAYTRIGGWPGVAGWEYKGMQSPIITSVPSTAALLVAPLLGLFCWSLAAAARGMWAGRMLPSSEVPTA